MLICKQCRAEFATNRSAGRHEAANEGHACYRPRKRLNRDGTAGKVPQRTVRLTDAEWAEMRRLAKAAGQSVSEMVRARFGL